MKKLLRNPFLNTSFFKFKKKGSESGFSLMEIIIVIAIIGTLVGVIISRISGGADNAKVGITDTKAFTLQSKLIQYQMAHDNKFPTSEQGLQALTQPTGGVAIATEDETKDGWGNPFVYKLTAQGPLIQSMGKDGGQEGGASSALCYLNGKKVDCATAEGGGGGAAAGGAAAPN